MRVGKFCQRFSELLMKILFEELSTLVSSMPIEDTKVTDLDFIENMKVLNTSIVVLHVLSLSYFRNNSSVKTLHLKLKLAYSESVIWFQINDLLWVHSHENCAN
jgi:hypothetical protein